MVKNNSEDEEVRLLFTINMKRIIKETKGKQKINC
jgi:hypothetical protein